VSHLTPVGSRLSDSLSDEYLRMQNEWFFKWHLIGEGRAVEIDSFRGKPICYGRIKFSGSAADVYWDTIHAVPGKGCCFRVLQEASGRRLRHVSSPWSVC
jgi:hypothetical protein